VMSVLVSTSGLRHTIDFLDFLPFLSLLRAAPRSRSGGDLLLSSLVAPLSIRLVSIPVSSERSELVSPLLIREESSFPDTDLS